MMRTVATPLAGLCGLEERDARISLMTEKNSFPLERDPVIEAYKKDVDRTILRENLKLSVEERLRALVNLQRAARELRRAGHPRARLKAFWRLLPQK